jgi:hypothetical protein
VRLYSGPGNDFTRRFPLIVEALERLRSRSCIIDGEAVACDDNGVSSFDLIRYRRDDAHRRGPRNLCVPAVSSACATKNQKTRGPISSIMRVPSTSQASIPSLGARSHRDTAAIVIVNSCLE